MIKLTVRCWKSQDLITLVASFGNIPRFFWLFEKPFESKSSIPSPEPTLPRQSEGENWNYSNLKSHFERNKFSFDIRGRLRVEEKLSRSDKMVKRMVEIDGSVRVYFRLINYSIIQLFIYSFIYLWNYFYLFIRSERVVWDGLGKIKTDSIDPRPE